MTKPLVVIPTFLSAEEDVTVVGACIKSIRNTVSDTVDVLLVDDCSPRCDLHPELHARYGTYDFEVHHKDENSGYSRTINVGLQRALDEGRDAVTINADMEMLTPGWVNRCLKTTGSEGQPAAVIGAHLKYPNGLIQHAGIYFSLLTRTFDHRFKYGPENLPAALKKYNVPVTGAFQYIRHECLEKIGLYDEDFRMGWEDVDYCIRVFLEGMECIYNPNIRAIHHEQMFRGRKSEKVAKWTHGSWLHFCEKYASQPFGGLVPNW